jgi:hypothetical protein
MYFLQRHYEMPTRLLDWSTNPLSALFFASDFADHAQNANGEVFMMDVYEFSRSLSVEFDTGGEKQKFEGIATAFHPAFSRALKVITEWHGTEKDFPAHIIPVRPRHVESRIVAQRGCFTFHVPGMQTLPDAENGWFKKLKIHSLEKRAIRDSLLRLGVDDYSVYGGLDKLTVRLKNIHP